MFERFLLLFLSGALLAACGDDGGTTADTGTDSTVDSGDDGGTDGGMDGAAPSCVGIEDGARCGDGFLCLGGTCAPSRCGDGYVDEGRGEACDDDNFINGDGCDDDCTLTCTADADCDDANPCNGEETCGTMGCVVGLLPADGTVDCMVAAVTGTCYGGLCSPPDCGNSTVDTGEDCDDGRNGNQTDGCRDDCSYTCDADEACDDGDACNGAETCSDANTCEDPGALDCDDGDPCTADSCDMVDGCVNDFVDVDGDGYAAATCTTAGLMGDDCDDDDATAYPGAAELCDEIDNDCDGTPDNDTADIECQRDQDMDGYGDMSMAMSACSCPAGYIPPRGDGEVDCKDLGAVAASINPGVTAFSPVGYCPGGTVCTAGMLTYDWNCDGVDEPRWTETNYTCSLLGGCRGRGWTGADVPACGEEAEQRACALMDTGGGAIGCVEASLGLRTQECI